MSRSEFFNKVPGKEFLGEQEVDFLSWLCFVRCLLLPFFLHSIYVVVSYSEMGIVPWLHLYRPFPKIRDIFKGKIHLFKDYYIFGT